MAEVSKTTTGATEATDVEVGNTITYIDGQSGIHMDAKVLSVSANGVCVDIEHPDPKQPRRNAVQYSDDGVWHSWHFKPEDEAPMPATNVTEQTMLNPDYTKPASTVYA